MKAWGLVLEDVDYEAVACVLVEWFKRETWPPDPAELRQRVRTRERDERVARESAELIEGYRKPALGEGWMGRAASPTRTNEEATAQVVELAAAWQRREIGLDSIRRQCSGYDRFIAMNHAREQVRELIEALAGEDDAREGIIRTSFGGFTSQDLHEHGGIVSRVDGRARLVWPVSGTGRGSWRYTPTGGA